jgi:hypothetical protein
VTGADVLTMNSEQLELEQRLVENKEACWVHIEDVDERRKVQNRVNKATSRWKFDYHLETVQDYHILLSKVEAMRDDQPWRPQGRLKKLADRPKRKIQRSKRRTSQRLAQQRRRPEDVELLDADSQNHDFQDEGLDQDPTFNQMAEVADGIPIALVSDISSDEHSLIFSNETDRRTETDKTTESIPGSFLNLSSTHDMSHFSNVDSLADECSYNLDNVGDTPSATPQYHFGERLEMDSWVEIHKDGSGEEDLAAFEHLQPPKNVEKHTQQRYWRDTIDQNSVTSLTESRGIQGSEVAIDWCSLIGSTIDGIDPAEKQSLSTPQEPWVQGHDEQHSKGLDDMQPGGIVYPSEAPLRERFRPHLSSEERREASFDSEEQRKMVLFVFCKEWAALSGRGERSGETEGEQLGYTKLVEHAWKSIKASPCSESGEGRNNKLISI